MYFNIIIFFLTHQISFTLFHLYPHLHFTSLSPPPPNLSLPLNKIESVNHAQPSSHHTQAKIPSFSNPKTQIKLYPQLKTPTTKQNHQVPKPQTKYKILKPKREPEGKSLLWRLVVVDWPNLWCSAMVD